MHTTAEIIWCSIKIASSWIALVWHTLKPEANQSSVHTHTFQKFLLEPIPVRNNKRRDSNLAKHYKYSSFLLVNFSSSETLEAILTNILTLFKIAQSFVAVDAMINSCDLTRNQRLRAAQLSLENFLGCLRIWTLCCKGSISSFSK